MFFAKTVLGSDVAYQRTVGRLNIFIQKICSEPEPARGSAGAGGGILKMGQWEVYPEFEVVRSSARCTKCLGCVAQCANGVHQYDGAQLTCDSAKCVGDRKSVV